MKALIRNLGLVLANSMATLMVLLMSSPAKAHGPGGSVGLGVMVGDPSGLSLRYMPAGAPYALDFLLAYSWDDNVIVAADYKFLFPGLFSKTDAAGQHFHPFLGVGAVLSMANGAGDFLGLRVPVGLEWVIPRSQLALQLELAPGIGIIPSTDAFAMAGLAIRYYF